MIDVPDHLRMRWPGLVLIERGKVSWTELETVMSIDDVMDMDEACTLIAEVREAARELPEAEDDEL